MSTVSEEYEKRIPVQCIVMRCESPVKSQFKASNNKKTEANPYEKPPRSVCVL